MTIRATKIVLNSFLFCASLAVALALVELGTHVWLTRFASDDQVLRYGTVEQNRQRIKENALNALRYEGDRYLGYLPTRNYRNPPNYHNALGFRGEEFPERKPEGEFRVFCLGGSTTYTSMVADPANAYPAQLQTQLHERDYPNVRVINAGADGWASYETLVSFEFRLLPLEPDLIVVYHGINDLLCRLVYPYDAYRGDNSGSRATVSYTGLAPWYASSDFLRCVLIRRGVVQSPMSLRLGFTRPADTNRWWEYLAQASQHTYPSGIFLEHPIEEMLSRNRPDYFARNMEHLIIIAKKHKVRVVLVTFFLSASVEHAFNAPAFHAAIQEQNELLADLGRRYDVDVYDFANAFPDDPKYFVDSVHLNEDGAQLKARMIGDYLIQSGVVPRRNGSNPSAPPTEPPSS